MADDGRRMSTDRFYGGVTNRIPILQDFLAFIREEAPTREEVYDWVAENTGGGGKKFVDRNLSFFQSLHLVRFEDDTCHLGVYGTRYVQTHDSFVVLQALRSGTKGFDTILTALAEDPHTDAEIEDLIVSKFKSASTGTAIKRHREWLQALGYVAHEDDLNTLTSAGRDAVERLNLADDQSMTPPATGDPIMDWIDVLTQQCEATDIHVEDSSLDGFHACIPGDPDTHVRVHAPFTDGSAPDTHTSPESIHITVADELDAIEGESGETIISVVLDTDTPNLYDPVLDDFLYLTADLLQAEATANRDLDIPIQPDGTYGGSFAGRVNNWHDLLGIFRAGETDVRYFWVNKEGNGWPANGEELFYSSETSDGNARKIQSAFKRARPGDKVVVYRIDPEQKIAGLARIAKGLHKEDRGEDGPTPGITIAGRKGIDGPTWEELLDEPRLADSRPITSDNRMLFGELDQDEYEAILDMAGEKGDGPVDDRVESLRRRASPPKMRISLPEQLYFDDADELKRQIEATLNSGKHVIFTGPPGTGKTKLAKEVAKHCSAQYPEYVDDYRFTTATSAWTTFDTIGGYVPRQSADGDELVFQPRIFLNCFREDETRNDWLVIDEINRSDIDKAFGQLFSVLSGDTVELPYEREDPVEIVALDSQTPDNRLTQIVESNDLFPVTASWRLLATMNTYDKASLYELSYAFMRRFNFIHVGVPALRNEAGQIRTSLLNPESGEDNYATKWASDDEEMEQALAETYDELAVIWAQINEARSIGPSIILDILSYIAASDLDTDTETLLTDAIIALVYPQLEGMRPQDQQQLIDSLSAADVATETGPVTVALEQDRLRQKAEDFFNIEFSDDE